MGAFMSMFGSILITLFFSMFKDVLFSYSSFKNRSISRIKVFGDFACMRGRVIKWQALVTSPDTKSSHNHQDSMEEVRSECSEWNRS